MKISNKNKVKYNKVTLYKLSEIIQQKKTFEFTGLEIREK